MPDSISFEDALVNLQLMFPEWDKDTLEALLVSNDYHVERTIETVLTMSGDTNVFSPSQSMAVEPTPANIPRETHKHSKRGRYRGTKCNLPDDFLRSPAWEDSVIADEELAVMLQNELFRQEVRDVFGEDLVDQNQTSTNTSNTRRPSTATAPGTSRTPSGATDNTGDLGIVKAISSMGSAARRNLAQMADRFSRQNTATSANARRSESGTTREFAPLMEMTNLEDETEVISFDSHNSRSRHRLQGGNQGHGHMNDEDEDEFNSENPLYAKSGIAPPATMAKNKSI